MKKLLLLPVLAVTCLLHAADTANWQPVYDESKVPAYTLPDPLTGKNGKKITTVQEWEKFRRPEILADFRKYLYGQDLPMAEKVEYQLLSEKRDALDGTAIRREVRLIFTGKNRRKFSFDILLYLPRAAKKPVPFFAGLNFKGNHTLEADKELHLTGLKITKTPDIAAAESDRGKRIYRFPLKTIISRGYAIATACYHDIFPDRKDGWQESVYTLFYTPEELKNPPHERYSAIGAWSWGIRRITDHLVTLPEIDASRGAVFGHSRLGKTSLWTGAVDQRFKLICVNDAGSGGTALTRRLYGETLYSMCFIRRAPGRWWFVSAIKEYADGKVHLLPFDQHLLVALAAPRSIAIHSATEDLWADPKGEYLSAYHAGKVFSLYGKTPLKSAVQPPPETPVGTDISYLLRTGKHDLLRSDWLHYLDMADRIFKP